MNLQKISNSAFRIIDLCHQIASDYLDEKEKQENGGE